MTVIGYEVCALKQAVLVHRQPIKNKFLSREYIIFHMLLIVSLPHPWQANFAHIVSDFLSAVNGRLLLELRLFDKE